jgi:4-alpha-glucanotransferase
MPFPRAAGILLHPTSLPGAGGIGSLGSEAHALVETLDRAGMRLWQVLPLGPTGYGDAPYSALSAFAGNPLLIALEQLADDGLLAPADLEPLACLPDTRVDFGAVIPLKTQVLHRSFERFPTSAEQADALHRFREENAGWLEDAALFLALKQRHAGAPWWEWEPGIRMHEPRAVRRATQELAHDIEFQVYLQWQFWRQWQEVRQDANERGIRIIGDLPIFVAHDSTDVWANQDIFKLDAVGAPTVVTGVPPDYFSTTGQLWGNPHYHWEELRRTGFAWWIERFRQLFRQVDYVRIDHFRGFAASWEVPFREKTAVRGRWVKAPGEQLFAAVGNALGEALIIAEDLGVITPDVVQLRDRFSFPGMEILQFAFSSDATDSNLPHNFPHHRIVYTGTHDNDTTLGWFTAASPSDRARVLAYVGTQGIDIVWDMIRLAFASVADQAVVPLQDVLRLGTVARMNLPGRPSGNWTWRFLPGAITEHHVRNLHFLAETYGRIATDVSG